MCFNAFAHISRPPETFLQKRFFMHLRKFPDHQNHFFKKDFFWPSGVVKNVFWCICAYFQTTRNFFVKKDIFERLECLKCVCMHLRTFPDTRNISLKKIFLTVRSGVKNVFWCIWAYFQTTSNFFSKKIFVTVWSG